MRRLWVMVLMGGMLAELSPSAASTATINVQGAPGTEAVTPVESQGLDPQQVGLWEGPYVWPVVAIHASVLPTGKVLHFAFPGGLQNPNAYVWDPSTGEFTAVPVNRPLFCSGHTFLADGRLLVAGGNGPAPEGEFRGIRDTHIFDPFNETWTRVEDMADGRWYPTTVTLSDGRVLVFSGLDELTGDVNADVEIYELGVGWQVVSFAAIPLYPLMFARTSGDVFCAGPSWETFTLAVNSWTWSPFLFTNFGWRGNGTWAPLPTDPDKVIIIGGGHNSIVTATAEIIDLAETNPAWQYTEPMNVPRMHANAVILPDGTVLVVGGHSEIHQEGGEGPPPSSVYEAEIFDPETGTWSVMAAMQRARVYHSTAVLLPDARVLSGGSDGEFTTEIYSPPYLFAGARPTIQSVPATIAYGSTFSLQFTSTTDTNTVALLRPSSVTHSVNMDQRYVRLAELTTGDGTVMIPAPATGNLAPPGYYMLFVVDANGVPSEADMIRLEENRACPCHADPVCDGQPDVFDVVHAVGAAFRNETPVRGALCPYDQSDVDCDDDTDVFDVVHFVAVAFRNADPAVEFCEAGGL